MTTTVDAPRVEREVSDQPVSARPAGVRAEGVLVFCVALAIFAGASYLLDFHYRIYPPDAVFRMANGFYVLFSRHFHLAAIGFVWNPLMSLADMVPLAFKTLWFPLVDNDVAASIVTALSMAGAAYQLHACMREWGVARVARLVLTATFVLNPMVLYYSANGMSEALYMFTVVAATRYLRRWMATDDTTSLVYCGVMLGLCYLTREEGVLVAAAAAVLIFLVGAHRAKGAQRWLSGLSDTLVGLFPFGICFVGWALASWVITGSAFAQFTSQYGNSAQLASDGSTFHLVAGHYFEHLSHEMTDFSAIAPLLPVALAAALIVALVRRDAQILAPVAILGGGLAFTVVTFLLNQEFPWFRFYILAIPLEVLCVASLAGSSPGGGTRRFASLRGAGVATAMAIVLVAPSILTTARAMANPNIGIEESSQLRTVLHPSTYRTPPSDAKLLPVLAYLNAMHLPEGDVITDDAADCQASTVIRAQNPRIFVIVNDADFQKVLANPLRFHAHYLLAPPPGGPYDAVTAYYPNLYDSGAGIAQLVKQFPSTAICPQLRLYRVVR